MLPGLEAALPRSELLWGFSVGKQNGTRKERAFPVLSSSCFRNKQADPADPVSSTWALGKNTESLPDYRLRQAPYHLLHADSTATCLESPGSWNIRAGLPPSTERSQISYEVRLTPRCWGQREGGTCGDEPVNPTLPASPSPAISALPHEQVISFPSETRLLVKPIYRMTLGTVRWLTMKMYLRGADMPPRSWDDKRTARSAATSSPPAHNTHSQRPRMPIHRVTVFLSP